MNKNYLVIANFLPANSKNINLISKGLDISFHGDSLTSNNFYASGRIKPEPGIVWAASLNSAINISNDKTELYLDPPVIDPDSGLTFHGYDHPGVGVIKKQIFA